MDIRDIQALLRGEKSVLDITIPPVKGYAAVPSPVEENKEKGRLEAKFVWQGGPSAPQPGETDLVLLGESSTHAGQTLWPIAVVDKEVAERLHIEPGDLVEARTFGTKRIVDGVIGFGPVELPLIGVSAIQMTATSLVGAGLPSDWQLTVNGYPPSQRRDWRFGYSATDAKYPTRLLELGLDYQGDPGTQIVAALTAIGAGQKLVITAPAGAGKTVTTVNLLKAIIEHNPGVYVLASVVGERQEDVGLMMRHLLPAVFTGDVKDGILRPEVVGFEHFNVDADLNVMYLHLLRVAQIAALRAQRLAETAVQHLPPEEWPLFVLVMDGLSRVEDAGDLAKVGGTTKSGGRDSMSAFLSAFIALTGRVYTVALPDGGQAEISATVIGTLLGNPGDRATEIREGEQKAVSTNWFPVGDRKDWPAEARGPIVPYVPGILTRHLEDLLPPWQVEAIRVLYGKVVRVPVDARSGRKLGPAQLDGEGWVWFERELAEQGNHVALHMSLVEDQVWPDVIEMARSLIETGTIQPNDLKGPDSLRRYIILPPGWEREIWEELASDGLVEPLDLLHVRQLAQRGLIREPEDITKYFKKKINERRAQEIWEQLLEEGLVTEEDSEDELVPRKEEGGPDLTSDVDPEVELLVLIDQAVKAGKVFYSPEDIEEHFEKEIERFPGVDAEDLAEEVWERLPESHFAVMAIRAKVEAHAGALKREFNLSQKKAGRVRNKMWDLAPDSKPSRDR